MDTRAVLADAFDRIFDATRRAADGLQHAGQAAYVRGLLERRG